MTYHDLSLIASVRRLRDISRSIIFSSNISTVSPIRMCNCTCNMNDRGPFRDHQKSPFVCQRSPNQSLHKILTIFRKVRFFVSFGGQGSAAATPPHTSVASAGQPRCTSRSIIFSSNISTVSFIRICKCTCNMNDSWHGQNGIFIMAVP